MAIPKKIHWCWLSGDPLPPMLQKCIRSWKRVLPDYEIICWDMQRFDIHSVKFVEQACAARKWAFAADYIRLYALYTEGGIYLDSDVMVFKKFDRFLHYAAFSGIDYVPHWIAVRNEKHKYLGYGIQAAVIGAEKGNPWIKMCMEHYHDKDFTFENEMTDAGIAPEVLAHYAHTGFGFQYDKDCAQPQYLKGNIALFPPWVFANMFLEANLNSYVLHLGEYSWGDNGRRSHSRLRKFYRKLCSANRFFAMMHYLRKRWIKKLTGKR
jgi:hypothetical protein